MAKSRKRQSAAEKAAKAKRQAAIKALRALGLDNEVIKGVVGSLAKVKTPKVSNSRREAVKPKKVKPFEHGEVDLDAVDAILDEDYPVSELDIDEKSLYVTRAKALKMLFPTLTVELTGTWVWVSGATREFAEALGKNGQGLKFAGKKKQWYIAGKPSNNKRPAKMSWIREKYGAEEISE